MQGRRHNMHIEPKHGEEVISDHLRSQTGGVGYFHCGDLMSRENQ